MVYSKSDYYSSYQEKENFGYKGKEIVTIFEEADKEIPNISVSYEKDPDAVYISRVFTFNNLPKPVNSSAINSYLEENINNEGRYCIFIFNILVLKIIIIANFPFHHFFSSSLFPFRQLFPLFSFRQYALSDKLHFVM